MTKPAGPPKYDFRNTQTWQTQLISWSDFPLCAEVKLICAVIASAITEPNIDMDDVDNGVRFWGYPLEFYCKSIGLDADFVRSQILRGSSMHGLKLTDIKGV